MRIKLPLIGQAYEHRSLDLSAQTLKGWFPEINNETGDIVTLQPWPGDKLFSSANGQDGGMYSFNGSLFKVSEETLYRVSSAGIRTAIGDISGSGLCSFVSNSDTMIIVRSGNVYSYNGSTLSLETDPDFEAPDYVTYLNNQAIYNGNNARFSVSDAGNLTTINGLNFASAESLPDDLLRPYVHRETLYLFGINSIEQWYNSGSGSPPFDRINNGTIPVGTNSPDSIASTQTHMYFLGSDNIVYRLLGSELTAVSIIPIAQEFSKYTSSGQGFVITLDGQNFYIITFKEAAWCYSESANSWFELTSGKPTSYIRAYNKHLISIDGSIFELDHDSFTSNGEAIRRERVSPPVTAASFMSGGDGLKVEYNQIEIVAKVVGSASNDGPKLMFDYSDDSGRTYSNQRMMQASRLGEYIWRFRINSLGSAYSRIFRVSYSEPTFISLHSAVANIEVSLG